jgi:glycerol-1-phosphate dehydrogenase [NAD(P)+]
MQLAYDPGEEGRFWNSVKRIPGYPIGEEIGLRRMIFASDAIINLTPVLLDIGAYKSAPLLVVMDQTSMRRGDDSLKPLLIQLLQESGWEVMTLILGRDQGNQVHADLPTIEEVKNRLKPGMAVLSVGSGTITDVTKHALYLYQNETGIELPHMVYQTANSVTAYTSNMAVLFIDGVKRTFSSRYPNALICDLETLRDAPYEMTVAGVGDMLAVYVSLPDWYLAYRFGLDQSYTELPQRLLGPLDEILLNEAAGIKTGSLESMGLLAKLIALAGFAMSLSHATTPLSGFEHVISHMMDMQAEAIRRPLAQHGTQVALASILGVQVYRHVLDDFDPSAFSLADCFPEAERMWSIIEGNIGALDPTGKAAQECYSDYRQKLEVWHSSRSQIEAALLEWPSIRSHIIQKIRPVETLIDILHAVGSPLLWSELDPPFSEQQVKFSFMNAPLMRKRFTIGDFLIFFSFDRDKLWHNIWARTRSISTMSY